MQQQPQPEKSFKQKTEEMLNIGTLIIEVLSKYSLVFVRRNIGPYGLGVHAFIAFFVLLVIAASEQDPKVWQFLGVWLLTCASQSGRTRRLMRKGWRPHSRWGGEPHLARMIVRSERLAYAFEPILILLIGMGLAMWSTTVGGLFVISGIALLGSRMAESHQLQVQVQRMHDAKLEQQRVMDAYERSLK